MAFRKSFSNRLFHCCKTIAQSAASERTPIPPSPRHAILPPNAFRTKLLREHLASPHSPRRAFYGRLHNRRAVYYSGPSDLPECLSLPVGEKLRERLKAIGIEGDRLRLDGLGPPAREKAKGDSPFGMTVNDARKILKLSRVEKLKAKLREIPRTSISHSEYMELCVDACENVKEGAKVAKMLDESGNVIVWGNVVFLRPEQVAKTMESLIWKTIGHPKDPRRMELEEMEKQKAMIDEKANALVRGELYCGLVLLVLQTLAFMRLTFWELSWDVMEPICFFVTSFHFALAYLFFLKTSTEPSFQGYFFRRFTTKQQRLMKTYQFDAHRYNELCRAFYPNHDATSEAPFCSSSRGNILCSAHH
ncbi:calcium uniporter protein 4, mitochondrial-like [Neltuma alba]|uniref:calcium uniporter protein 4, mitochondrial-like n=1 Tax=Neltuma alba TaxID=207710 RepID=UPI0010A37942|nr:calcium uniporter protein 4, mitochondrial-like [Prosopis alba]XP_028791620.1 calcium uniporter protein 4, mitochondrial-like [Prosopis alba]